MEESGYEGRVPEPDRVQQPLGENPSDEEVREYFVAALDHMGADGAVLAAARDALHEIESAEASTSAQRTGIGP